MGDIDPASDGLEILTSGMSSLVVFNATGDIVYYEAFDGISALSFKILDAPTNGMVEISCALSARGRTLQMQTVAQKRN